MRARVERHRVTPPAPPRRKEREKRLPLEASFRALLLEAREAPGRRIDRPLPELSRPPVVKSRGAEGEHLVSEGAPSSAARVDRAPLSPEPPAPPREASPPRPLGELAVEQLLVIPDVRALRLKLAGRAGAASVEVELSEGEGELAVTIATEDGDRRRAEAWARRVERALSRRGLRGEIRAE